MKCSLAIVMFSMLLFHSCIEEVKIEDLAGPTSGRLVVEGLITNEAKTHRVTLTRVTAAVAESSPAPVTGARVSISDGEVTWSLSEYPDGSGVYLTDSTVRGEIGKIYTLTVLIGEKVYVASDKMQPPAEFDDNDRYIAEYLGKGKDGYYLGGPQVLYGSNFPARVTYQVENTPMDSILTYYSFPGVDPDNVFPTFSDQIHFRPGDRLIQTKYSLSTEHYLFLRALLLEVKYYGGFVGSVRANVPTNLSEGALGFFGASAVNSRQLKIG